MHKLIWKWINKTKEFFGILTQKNIFDIAEKGVSEFKEWESHINPENRTWYMGKVFKSTWIRDGRLYNDDFVLFSLWYLFKNIPKWQKVTIRVWIALSAVANGPEDVKDCMDFAETREYVMGFVKKYFPERIKDIDIIDISQEESNKDLFKELGDEWISALDTEWQQPQLSWPCTSLDIAKYLYWASENNKLLKIRLKKILPKDRVKSDGSNFPKYYGLIEIACRLMGFLNGQTLQWWAERQNIYDEVIMTILGWRWLVNEKYPELMALHVFCLNVIGWHQHFSRAYLYRNTCKELKWKIDQESEKKRGMARIIWRTTFGLLWVLWIAEMSYQWFKENQQKKNKETEQEIVHEIMLSKTHPQREADVAKMIDSLDIWTIDVYDYFIENYSKGNLSKDELIAHIRNELRKWNNMTVLFNHGAGISDQSLEYFIRHIFIPENAVTLASAGAYTLSHQEYLEHKDAFENTDKFYGDLEFTWRVSGGGTVTYVNLNESSEKVLKTHGLENKWFYIYEIGVYTIPNGEKYSLWSLEVRDYSKSQSGEVIKYYIVWRKIDESDANAYYEKQYSIGLGKIITGDIMSRRQEEREWIDNAE